MQLQKQINQHNHEGKRKVFNKKGELIDWEYSIFRNNVSDAGVCAVCQRRADAGLKGIDKPKGKYNKNNPNHFIRRP